MLAMVLALLSLTVASVNARVIFTESFETPVLDETSNPAYTWKTSGFGASGPWNGNDWVGWSNTSGKYTGINNTGINDPENPHFVSPFGDQVAFIFNNIVSGGKDLEARMTTTIDSLDAKVAANMTYTLKFNTASLRSNEIEYHVQLIAVDDEADPVVDTVLAEIRGPVASNDLAANSLSFAYRSGDAPANLGERIAIRLKKGNGSYEYNVYYDNISFSADKMNVSPYDGALVPAGNVDLSWTNLDPNVGDTVWVDVLFGTEPNAQLPGYDMAKDLTAGENATSTQVTAVAGKTYYWQIVSYIYGDSTTDPCASDVYSFTALGDVPVESVNILTEDMVTWSGEPVALDCSVDDDGESDLTYAWRCDLADGVSFSATDIPNPTITITKDVGIGVIPLTDPGFENPRDAGDGAGFIPYPDGDRDILGHLKQYTWLMPSWGYHYNGLAGVYNPTADAYVDEAPEGQNVGIVDSRQAGYYSAAGGFKQTTNASLETGIEYTLSVKVGNPLYNNDFPGYRVQILAGGSVIAQDNDSLSIELGTFVTSTVKFSVAADHAKIGEMIEIRLMTNATMISDENSSLVYEVHFDDVKLTTNTVTTVIVTLGVSDEASVASVTDTMTIDVYDNACLAKVGIGQAVLDAGDINFDCVTDDKDLDSIAAAWLDSTALEVPAVDDMSGGDAVGDPNALSVDAGKDVITWSGQEVALAPVVFDADANEPPAALIYTWSANPAAGVAFSANDVEAPTVTITKAAGDATAVTITLAINKEGREAADIEDTMTIDVYDDACKAMIGAGEGAVDPADIDGNCTTNLADFAVVAETWLIDHGVLTEPTPKP